MEAELMDYLNGEQSLIIKGEPMAKNGQIEVQNVPINKIKMGKNSRTLVQKEALEGLMQSIKQTGLLQPIGLIRKNGSYEICYGNRRFLAVSKLGLSKIPAIIHESKVESDIDMKNLTENIQRRNLALNEVGRYIDLLKKEKLSTAEIAVRLGVSDTYVRSCLNAYNEVPDKFKQDLETSLTTAHQGKRGKRSYGKITVPVANTIIGYKKKYSLSEKQTEVLFEAAKHDERFEPKNLKKYAMAVKNENKDPIGSVKPLTHVECQFWITKEHKRELEEKYVDNGPFSSFNGLVKAILSGKKSVRFEIVEGI